MEKMQKFNDLYIENDKIHAPFLLAASFSGLIKFVGSFSKAGVLYLQFAPRSKAEELINKLSTKTEPHIPAKDLFEAINYFWKQVTKGRNEGMNYERQQTT